MRTAPTARTVLVGIALMIIILVPRVFDLEAFLSPDEPRWLTNVGNFTTKLAHGEFRLLTQQPHPGITTQWLGALTIYADSWTLRKMPLIIGQSLLILAIGYVFARLWGKLAGLLLVLLLALNPALIAHTRVYAMDSLLALFLLFSLGLLLLWKQEAALRYLLAAATAGAAAFLSKLPGILIMPFTWAALVWWERTRGVKPTARALAYWSAAFAISLIIILPPLALSPAGTVGYFLEFFGTDDYQELHQYSAAYYLGTLAFFLTPLQLVGSVSFILLLATAAFTKRYLPQKPTREQATMLFLFAALFILQMTVGAKKGDRYILPSLLLTDAFVVIAALWASRLGRLRQAVFLIVTAGLLWQTADITRLHPHALAYVNPITKPWLGDRRMGWGEGLDIAAAYLNQKPDANQLTAAAYFPTQFSYVFNGRTVPLHQWEEAHVDYAILYRAMLQRGPDAWETDVLEQFASRQPEKIIELGGVEYVWIYRLSSTGDKR